MPTNSRFSIIFFFVALFSVSAFSQTPHRCHTDERMQTLFAKYPKFKQAHENKFKNKLNAAKSQQDDIITIPVHVIIVHPPGQAEGTGDNLSMDHIVSQIDVLNEDFRRLNDDASNTPPEFSAVDTEIEFCLAIEDEDGNESDGVTRYPTNQNFDANEFSIKAATGWDRDTYLNIWVAPTIGALGYAYVPTTTSLPNATLDGVAVLTSAFGGPGFATHPVYNLGRTATHEVGHYLGLDHVWGSGGCVSDDGMDDTPIQNDENFGCPSHPSPSCGNSGDMFMNYMDYVNDDCMNAFTDDQRIYMREILNTSRSSLLDAASMVCESAVPELSGEIIFLNNISCFGEADGTIEVTGIDGVPPYQYSLDGGDFGDSGFFNNLDAGNYIITIQDDAGQTFDINFEITQPDQLEIAEIDRQNITCFGESTGSITVVGIGGDISVSGNYEYAIDGGQFGSSNVFTNLDAGLHVVEVMDDNMCIASIEIFLTQPNELIVDIENLMNVSCFGENDGSANASISGGTDPYSIFLNGDPQNDAQFDNLSPGNYSVFVLDFNGCEKTEIFTITEPTELVLTEVNTTNAACEGEATGSIEVIATGGTPTYEYSIDGTNYQVSPIFNDLEAQVYTVIARDDNQCTQSLELEVGDGVEIAIEIIEQTEAGCDGEASGSVSVEASGGNSPYEYTLDETTNSTGVFIELSSGTYTIVAKDDNDCESSLEVTIEEPESFVLELESQTNPICFGDMNGSVTIIAMGNSSNYLYSDDDINYGPENTFNDLSAGVQNFYAIDENNCRQSIEIEITQPSELILEQMDSTEAGCDGLMTGSVTVEASGGTNPYTYSLGQVSNNSGLFENLAAGDYIINVTDNNDCQTEINVTIEEPEAFNLEIIETTMTSCFGGSDGTVTALASGDGGPYSYSLDDNNYQSEGTFDNVGAGPHTLFALDQNNCKVQTQFNIGQPDQIEIQIVDTEDVSCFGESDGSANISISGGTGSYEVFLDDVSGGSNTDFSDLAGGTYEIRVVDDNDCNEVFEFEIIEPDMLSLKVLDIDDIYCGSSELGSISISGEGGVAPYNYEFEGETNSTGEFGDIEVGNHEIKVIDANNCEASISFDINESSELGLDIIQQLDVSCFGFNDGLIELEASGGNGNYSYSEVTLGSNTTGVFEDVPPGDYDFTAVDDENCMQTIQITIDEPVALAINDSEIIDDTGSENGSVSINVVGGVMPYAYSLDGTNFQSEAEFTNLKFGDYTMTIRDANDCILEFNFSVDNASSLSDILEIEDLRIFPNPTEASSYLELELNSSLDLEITMISIEGKLIYSISNTFGSGKHRFDLNTESLDAAVYLVRIRHENSVEHFRLVKARN